MQIKLNLKESTYYETVIKPRIANMPKNVSFKPGALFDQDPTSDRICRKLFEDVTSGAITGICKNGLRSRDGYTAI